MITKGTDPVELVIGSVAGTMVIKNIVSNIIGKGLSALLSFVFVPFYLKYLGPEAYGLIGFHVFLQSIFMVADMGLSGTFSREAARLTALTGMAQTLRDLCRTFEILFVGIGIASALIIAVLADPIAEYWISPNALSVEAVATSVILIGLAVGLQFPFFVYQGGMQGLQRQTLLNFLLVSVGVLRGLGALCILIYVAPTIEAYFVWQVIVSLVQLVVSSVMIWRCLPQTQQSSRFDLKLLKPLWRFAVGMAGITLSGILLTQVDKLILSKMLTLENFGYYTLATVVASIPGIISYPVFNAVYPRFTQLVAVQNFQELSGLYHRTCQFMSVLLFPLGLLLSFFSREIILLWTGSSATAQSTCHLVSVLVIGSVLMGLMMMPYALQLSFAWTRIGLQFNIVALLVLTPALFWLVSKYGAIGACYAWMGLYLGQVLTIIHFMHRRVLQLEKWRWYLNDVAIPLVLPLLVMFAGRNLLSVSSSSMGLVVQLGMLLLAAMGLSALSANHIRTALLAKATSFGRV